MAELIPTADISSSRGRRKIYCFTLMCITAIFVGRLQIFKLGFGKVTLEMMTFFF